MAWWWAFFCGCGYEWAPVRGFFCLFWCETHTKGLRARFPTRPEEDEEIQGPRVVNRKELARYLWTWGISWYLWTMKPGQPTQVDESVFLVAVWKFCSRTGSWQPQKHRMQEKYPNFYLLSLTANPSPCLFILLSSSLDYIRYICYTFVKHVKCPG